MRINRFALAIAMGLGLVLAGTANAEPTCHHVSGKYFLEPAPEDCSAIRCYVGDFTGAGILSGKVRIEIKGVVLGSNLPGETVVWAYSAITTITTLSHGDVVYENFGFMVDDPVSDDPLQLFQTDTALIVSGTEDFESASGRNTSMGLAVIDPKTGFPLQLSGDVSGQLCLEK